MRSALRFRSIPRAGAQPLAPMLNRFSIVFVVILAVLVMVALALTTAR